MTELARLDAPDAELVRELDDANTEYCNCCHKDGSLDEAAFRDVGFNRGSLFHSAAKRLREMAAERDAFLAGQIENADANGIPAEYTEVGRRNYIIGMLSTKLTAAEDRLAAVSADAERYRWLREQEWSASKLCVVVEPKRAVKLGHDCPSLHRLDEAIDAARAASEGNKGKGRTVGSYPVYRCSRCGRPSKLLWLGLCQKCFGGQK